jgi:Flp pilus assembly protein TadD
MQLKWLLAHTRGYLELGMVTEAAAELARVPAVHSAEQEVMELQAAVLQEQQRWPELQTMAATLVQRDPANASWWITWAYAARRADSLGTAERILLQAEETHPNEATVQFNLGCYACVRGDLSEARRRVARAIELDGHFKDAARNDPDLEALRAADRQP